MGFFKYPYTDLNELNLDWMIAKIKYIEQASHILYDNSGTGLISNNVQDAINEIIDLISSQGVATWNGRAGIVVPIAGDYNAQMIDYDNTGSGLSATNSQSAIDELAARPLGGVESFNTRTGAVMPTAGDYSAADVTYDNSSSGLVATETQSAIDEVNGKIPASIVESFNNRTGSVTPAAGDYDAYIIAYDNATSGLTATDAQGAIDELDNRLDNFSVNASQVSYDNTQSGLTATDAQAALDEIANDVLSSGVASFNGRTGAVNPAAGDYDGSDIDYDNTGSGLTATDVQSAIDELAAGGASVPSGWYMTAIETISNNNTTDTVQARLKDLADQLKAKLQSLAVDERYVITGFDRGGTLYPYLGLTLWDSSATAGKTFKRINTSAASNEIESVAINQTLGNCNYITWTMTTTGNTVQNHTTSTYNVQFSIQLIKYKQVI